jgi:hypothetical protein
MSQVSGSQTFSGHAHDSDLHSIAPENTKEYSGWNFIED